jgi:hypothetical protein
MRSVDEFLYKRVGDRNHTIFKVHLSSAFVEESGRACLPYSVLDVLRTAV